MTLANPAKSELYTPSLSDVLLICNDLPEGELEQIKLFAGRDVSPDEIAIWFNSSQFQIACKAEEPLAVCGFNPIGPGVYRTFFLARPVAWEKYGREITAFTRSGMNEIMQREGIRRLETLCLASRKRAQAWYRILGLKYESTLRSFSSNGDDAVLYTKTEE